ncbi:MAG: RloB family protein [Pseudorhodoferax sp.]
MRLPATPAIKRRTSFVAPKVEIVIACEGQVTERHYFNSCKQEYGAGMVSLRWLPITGIPMTVVTAAIDEREALVARARKSRDSFDVFRVWAVFDRDEHPDVAQALALARANQIEVAFSNPCFELWPLLHLEDYGGVHGRHRVQSLLNERMPSFHHERAPVVDFDMIKNAFPQAYARAERLNKDRAQAGETDGCPTTTVGTLVKKIIDNGRGSFSRANRGALSER